MFIHVDRRSTIVPKKSERVRLALGLAFSAYVVNMLVSAERLPSSPASDWREQGGQMNGSHHSPLAQINVANVNQLGLAWYYDTHSQPGQIEGAPIVANGTLFGTLPWSVVFAVDLRTGKEKWRWDPQVSQNRFGIDARGVRVRQGPSLCCGPVNRGVAWFDGRVYVGTLDGRLVALDGETGRLLWSVQTTNPEEDYSITGAPRVVRGNVIVGNAGAEFGVRGYITAYDARTGRRIWRFYTVPGDPSLPFESEALAHAATTWTGPWWRYGGGGTVWDSMVYDPSLDLLYFGVGNGSPWNRDIRSPGGGDNLFLCSIVAIRPETGEYVWHYQTTPADNWDYAGTQPLILADLIIGGENRHVIMQAPKNGFFYVIDRVTGKFISAQPFVSVNWATGIDQVTGRPLETALASYGEEGVMISPGHEGAHNWQAMAFSPATKLVYLPAQETSSYYSRDPNFSMQIGRMNTGRRGRPNATTSAAPIQPSRPPSVVVVGTSRDQRAASLIAWNPVSQQPEWKIQFTQTGITGGALSTAGGLVFHGSNDGRFVAYRATDGERLWEVALAPGFANPISYEADGKQYIAVLTGRGGQQPPGRLYVFSLDGAAVVPEQAAPSTGIDAEKETLRIASVEASMAAVGLPATPARSIVARLCANCHSPEVFIRLKRSGDSWRATFEAMIGKGMGGTPEQRSAALDYLIQHLNVSPGNSESAGHEP